MQDKLKCATEVRHACEHVGFMYLKFFKMPSPEQVIFFFHQSSTVDCWFAYFQKVEQVFKTAEEYFTQGASIKSQTSWESKEVISDLDRN